MLLSNNLRGYNIGITDGTNWWRRRCDGFMQHDVPANFQEDFLSHSSDTAKLKRLQVW
jgi:hypothetical protein